MRNDGPNSELSPRASGLVWSDIYYVDWVPGGAVLATASGAVPVTREEGERAEARIAPWETARDEHMARLSHRALARLAGVRNGPRWTIEQFWAQFGFHLTAALAVVSVTLWILSVAWFRHWALDASNGSERVLPMVSAPMRMRGGAVIFTKATGAAALLALFGWLIANKSRITIDARGWRLRRESTYRVLTTQLRAVAGPVSHGERRLIECIGGVDQPPVDLSPSEAAAYVGRKTGHWALDELLQGGDSRYDDGGALSLLSDLLRRRPPYSSAPIKFKRLEPHPRSALAVLSRAGRLILDRLPADSEYLIAALNENLAERAEAVPAGPRRGFFAPHREVPGTGLWLTDQGLAVVEADRTREYAWSALNSVTAEEGDLAVQLADRSLRLGDYFFADDLAAYFESRLRQGRPQGQNEGELNPKAIEQWLGVPEGGSLRLAWRWPEALRAAGLVWLVAAMAGSAVSPPSSLWVVAIIAALLAVPVGLSPLVAGSATADGQAVEVRRLFGRRLIPWSKIGTAPLGSLSLTTADGPLRLWLLPGSDRLLGVARRLAAWRRRGLLLAHRQLPTQSALSMAEGETQRPNDRGLSLAGRPAEQAPSQPAPGD